jgi:uncharacterized membrane protein
MLRRDALREYARGSLWVVPTIGVLVALVIGSLLSHVNVGPTSILAFQGTADDARTLLISISATMVTVIALLLGLAVVALQLSSTQFSPRLLRNFLRDRPNSWSWGYSWAPSSSAPPACSRSASRAASAATSSPGSPCP